MDPEVPCSSQGGGTIPRHLFDLNALPQRSGQLVKNQDVIVGCDHRIPARALGKGLRGGAIGQGDLIGQGGPCL